MTQTAYDRLLDRLEAMGRHYDRRGRKPDWSLISCPGPIHERGDKRPSLVVKAQPGRARLTCKTGCDDMDVLAALGFDVPDLFDNGREVTYGYEDGWTVHRSWDNKAQEKKIWQDPPKNKGKARRPSSTKRAKSRPRSPRAGRSCWSRARTTPI
jgi:hypothetical protein